MTGFGDGRFGKGRFGAGEDNDVTAYSDYPERAQTAKNTHRMANNARKLV